MVSIPEAVTWSSLAMATTAGRSRARAVEVQGAVELDLAPPLPVELAVDALDVEDGLG